VRALGKPPYPAARRILEGTNADQVFQDVAHSCLKSRLS
jgi:hypothetical protein